MKRSAFTGKLVGVLLAIGLLGWVAWSSGYFQSIVGSETDEEPPTAMTAAEAMENAYARNDWKELENACRVLLDQDPFHAKARFNLGFSLYRQERLDEAAENYLQSKDFLPYRDHSLFNLACIYARQNKPELAIENLRLAVENGFASSRGILSNAELKSLYDHPVIHELVAKENENRSTYLKSRRR